MTLMSEQIGSDSTRRCDARCYNAKRAHCTCLCGGLNHGAGMKQAMDNLRHVFLPVLLKRGLNLGKVAGRIIADEQRQMLLPEMRV